MVTPEAFFAWRERFEREVEAQRKADEDKWVTAVCAHAATTVLGHACD